MTSVVSISRTRKGPATCLKQLPRLTAPLLRLNGLAPYYTMFPLSFPFEALANSNAGEWVLDPLFINRIRTSGIPWMGIIDALEKALPDVLDGRNEIARHLVSQFLTETFGEQGKGWGTEKRPKKSGLCPSIWPGSSSLLEAGCGRL